MLVVVATINKKQCAITMKKILRAIFKFLYKLKVDDLSFPENEAFVGVANHISYLDAPLIISCSNVEFRFVVYYKIYNNPFLKPFFKRYNAIPIASPKENRSVFDSAFKEIDKTLKSGNPVFIFPEGKISYDGQVSPIKGGIEHILDKNPVDVHVVAIKGLWGSRFSRNPNKKLFGKFRSRVQLIKGSVLSASEARRDRIREEFNRIISNK